jgi:hypothetical protein
MKKLVALIYKYYLYRNSDMAYLNALLTFLVIILLHIYFVFTVFNIFSILPEWYINNVEIPGSIIVNAFGVVLFVSFLFIFRKNDLKNYIFTDMQLISGWKKLIIYNSCVLFALLLFSLLS